MLAVIFATGCSTVDQISRKTTADIPVLHDGRPAQLENYTSRYYFYDQYNRENITPTNNVNGKAAQSEVYATASLQIASDDDVDNEFGRNFRKCFYVGELVIENRRTNQSFLAYSSSLVTEINYFVTKADWDQALRDDAENPLSKRNGLSERIKDLNAQNGVTNVMDYLVSRRRPSTYSDILAIFEYQRKANPKQRFIEALKSVGEIAAGATIFIGGPTYPKAVAFATGIITPEIEKYLLWDVLLHAKNLEARSLKEIEEVPAAGAIHRVVFFPKRPIPGVFPNNLAYISSFNPNTAVNISGSFIDKSAPSTAITGSVSNKK